MVAAALGSPNFRLKVVAGDTVLSDKKGSAGALAGSATQTLITRSNGDAAIRVTNGQLSITLPSYALQEGVNNGGITWAFDIQVETYDPNHPYGLLACFGNAAITATEDDNGKGVSLRQYGANGLAFVKDDATYSASATGLSAGSHNVVGRLTANQSGGYWRFDAWVDGVALPTANLFAGTNTALTILTLNANNTGGSAVSFNIRELPIWYGELASADCLTASSGVRAAIDNAPAGATVNEIGANASQGGTSSTGSATVAPAGSSGATAKTKPLAPFGGAAQIGVTVQNVVIMKLDRSIVLSLANQVTDGTGCLSVSNAALVAGTVYLMAYWNADGSLRGIAKVTAV